MNDMIFDFFMLGSFLNLIGSVLVYVFLIKGIAFLCKLCVSVVLLISVCSPTARTYRGVRTFRP